MVQKSTSVVSIRVVGRLPIPNRAVGLLLGLLVLGSPGAAGAASPGNLVGAAKAIPMEQALQRSQLAAEAVIHRRGRETCLRGKLTNALLGLSASCEAAGQRGGLCALADQAVVQMGWSLAFMDSTARQVLELMPIAPRR